MYLGYFCLSMMSCLWQTFCCLTSYYGIWGFFVATTVIGVKEGIYYEIGAESPSLDSQGGRKATHGNVNWRAQVENKLWLLQQVFNKYARKLCAREKYTNDQV